MAIVGKRTERREIPHEPGNFLILRTLSGPELDEADRLGTKRQMEVVKDMPDAIIHANVNRQAAGEAPERDEFRGYDHLTLAKYAVIGWEGPEYDGLECSDENKLQLDAPTLLFAARCAFEMNVRPLVSATDSESISSEAQPSPTNSLR